MKTSKENGQQELNRLIKMREICKEKLKKLRFSSRPKTA